MAREPRGDYARLLNRHMPELDALTKAGYYALIPDQPAPYRPLVRAHCRVCLMCGAGFTPTKKTQRFCGRPCLRRWHSGPGSTARRRAAAA